MTSAVTKSTYLSGRQCLKRLWYETHEPAEAEPGVAEATRLEWGRILEARAREALGPGMLVQREALGHASAVESTKTALGTQPRLLFQGVFEARGATCAVDALEQEGRRRTLIEIKSGTQAKPEHLEDLAFQAFVLGEAGPKPTHVEVMHVNRECRHPDLDRLFARTDVTAEVAALIPTVPERLAGMRAVLAGPRPEVAVGRHCDEPHACPFRARCWPQVADDHVSTLYVHRGLAPALQARGITRLGEIPDEQVLSPVQARQRRAARARSIVVEDSLRAVLDGFPKPYAYLDFETISPPVPPWPGCRPYDQIPVQFVCARERGGARAFSATRGTDPRALLALALLDACAGARSVFAFYASFERGCIRFLADHLPAIADRLRDLEGRIQDLHPVVRDHVYHLGFRGSFSIKSVLPTLLPHLAYDDLEVAEGSAAQAHWERLLLFDPAPPATETAARTEALRAYCERDVLGLRALHEWLQARS